MAHLVLYDGVCGFCNRAVGFILPRDRGDRFRFAPLQGKVAIEALGKYGKDPSHLDTFYLGVDWRGPEERLLWRSRAALRAAGELGGFWKACALVAGVLPTPILDLGYRLFARVRYRLFGKHDVCPVPRPEDFAKFHFEGVDG